MTKKLSVILEHRNGKLKKASYEAVKLAADLAAQSGAETEAVAIGADINDLESIGGYGISNVTHYRNAELDNYSPSAYSKIAAEHCKASGSDLVVLCNTSLGKDLAPRLAVKLDSGIIMDAIEFTAEDGNIAFTRPVYAGKALVSVKPETDKNVITIRPNVFNAGEPGDANAEVNIVEVSEVDLSVKVVEIKKSEGKLDVAEAEIVVSGGRGLKGPENFHLIEELSEVLGAAQGASRAVVDAGWRPHSEQVGQTGKTVSPNLYIAVGISGAIQHLAGMRSSKYIVAINKDKEAPIFQVADYGISGDAFEVLPPLIEELKKIKEN